MSALTNPFSSVLSGTALLYLVSGTVLAFSLITVFLNRQADAQRIDAYLVWGRVCLAFPMAVFGCDHFLFSGFVSTLIPKWLPAPYFWTYFVGVCLIAGALSMAVRKLDWLSTFLFAVMMTGFEVLMHIPNILRMSSSRVAWAVSFRDALVCAGFLACAATFSEVWKPQTSEKFRFLARILIGVALLFFSFEQFVFPELNPGAPINGDIPAWVPAGKLLSYASGVIFLVAAPFFLLNRKTRLAAQWVGCTYMVLACVLYLPITVKDFSNVGEGLNFLADTLLIGGGFLCLASKNNVPRENAIAEH